MASLLPWMDHVMAETKGHEDEAGLKEMISSLAYLADAEGVVLSSQIDEHFKLRPNTIWENTGHRGFVLALPEPE